MAGALHASSLLAASAAAALPAAGAGPAGAGATLEAVVASLSEDATLAKASDPDAAAAAMTALDQARSELAAGRGYGALLAVRDAWLTVEPLSGMAVHGAQIKDLASLARAADTLASELDAARRQVERPREPPVPLAVAALARAVWREAGPYQRAAVAYAEQTGIDSGVYYLELARAHANLAVWLVAAGSRLVAAADDGAPLDPGRVAALLSRLDGEAAAAFAPAAEAGTRQRAIGASARLKLAHELISEAAGERQGVAAAWLVAAQAARTLGAASSSVPPSAEELADQRRAVHAAAAVDASLRALVGEQVARDLGAGTEIDRRRAAATLAALSVLTAPASGQASTQGADQGPTRGRRPVPIILLRWPYT